MTLQELSDALCCIPRIMNVDIYPQGPIDKKPYMNITFRVVGKIPLRLIVSMDYKGELDFHGSSCEADQFPQEAFDDIDLYRRQFKEKCGDIMCDNDINKQIQADIKQLSADLTKKKVYDETNSTAKRITEDLKDRLGLSFKSKKRNKH